MDVLGVQLEERNRLQGREGFDEPGEEWDLFLSHDWGQGPDYENHKKVCRIAEALAQLGYRVWLDEQEMGKPGTLLHHMARGIERAKAVIVFVTDNYLKKVGNPDSTTDNCQSEFMHADNKKKAMIPVVMEEGLKDTSKWHGPVSLRISSVLYADMSASEDVGVLVGLLTKRGITGLHM